MAAKMSRKRYLDNCPPKKIVPPVRVGVLVKARVSIRVVGNQAIAPEENCPLVRVRVWLRVSFGVGEQFSSGAIVLESLFLYVWKQTFHMSRVGVFQKVNTVSIIFM